MVNHCSRFVHDDPARQDDGKKRIEVLTAPCARTGAQGYVEATPFAERACPERHVVSGPEDPTGVGEQRASLTGLAQRGQVAAAAAARSIRRA